MIKMHEYIDVEKNEKKDGTPTATSSSDYEQQDNTSIKQEIDESNVEQEVNLYDRETSFNGDK